MKKMIIVEGKHDDAFVKVLKPDIEAIGVELHKLGGQENLLRILQLQKRNFEIGATDGLGKLGIILDLDDYEPTVRLNFLNTTLKDVFGIELNAENQAQNVIFDEIKVEIICLFIKPNLDVLLRQISAQATNIADCIASCLENDTIPQKERDKEWVDTYMRYDVCSFEERRNAKTNVTYQFTASKNSWNFKSEHLNELKQFLEYFN